MLCEEVILGDFGELLHWFKGIFLHSPQFPVIMPTCADLVVVFGVERDSFYLGFGEVYVTEDPCLVEPIISNSLTINTICNNKSHILRILREFQRNYDSLCWHVCSTLCHYVRGIFPCTLINILIR